MIKCNQFPRSANYEPVWVVENQMGPNALWLMEWLCRDMDLKPRMRVLDMGCGKAISSVFLAREFGVQVFANDLWISASDNWKRICEAGVSDRVFPIHAESRSLPYAEGFFDAIVSVDSYHYYGTDDLYLAYFSKFVRPGGQIGIAVPGLMQDFDGEVPEHLIRKQKSGGVFWVEECWSIRTLDWWKNHWGHSAAMSIELGDSLPDGCRLWLQWERAIDAAGANIFPSDEEVLEADGGRFIGFHRLMARRKEVEPR
ncbi:methyltransferase domain-containing protein [bacterium]|nr:methyltransferase domain-containing protein [bacterium]